MWYDPEDDTTDYYDGDWESGLQHGFGIRQYNNGDRWVQNQCTLFTLHKYDI